ncbi:MAG: exosortase-associated EpsI family protein, partial [Isosphaeraceae bacterium]
MSVGRHVSLLASVAMAVAAGWVHGRWTGRWDAPVELAEAATRLEQVPREFRGWVGVDAPLDPRQVEAGHVAGLLSRTYRSPKDGVGVTALLVCGRPGPISLHTPDVCYTASGFESRGDPERVTLSDADGSPAHFWKGRFGKRHVLSTESRLILWSWTTDGRWNAPDHPRL